MKTRTLYINIIIIFSAIFISELALILKLNAGMFSYTLDDPYIHMALAKHIASGHYGINANEYSAPSSSIIWPYILAPFAGFGWFNYVPLIINYACSLGTIYLFTQLFSRLFAEVDAKRKNILTVIATAGIIVVTNIIGLAFAGMEHSLQVYLSLLLVYGVIISLREKRVPWWLMIAIIAGPLVRYENLALSLMAIVYLAAQRYWIEALGSVFILGSLIGGFSVYLHSLGLGYLPSSILAKSALAETGRLDYVIPTFLRHLTLSAGCIFLILATISSAYHVFFSKITDRYLAVIISAAIIAHMTVGYSGWYYRYDAYIISVAIMGMIYIFRGTLTKLYKRIGERGPIVNVVVLLIMCLWVGQIHLENTHKTIIAANNIFEQQYQMHRFVYDYYKEPVAINDLGWVAYENPSYVLDLWGLASLDALNARLVATNSSWMDRLAGKHNVKLAIIYDAWFRTTPKTWRPVAVMELSRERITPADRYVTFYALDSDSYENIKQMLLQFKEGLPAGVKLTIQ